MLERYRNNPILSPVMEHPWESVMVFNCGAIYEGGKVHLIYRAHGHTLGVSRLGYASSRDGFTIDERTDEPIFCPDAVNDMECRGVEDPRLTRIGDRIYMTYTAYGRVPRIPRDMRSVQIGMTSISVKDFVAKRWNWEKRYYPLPNVDDKDCVIFPEKIKNRYVMYHRIHPCIWIAYSDDLVHWYDHNVIMSPEEEWEYFKIGAGSPPIKTEKGWLITYHAVDARYWYRTGLALADLDDPSKIAWRMKKPLLEPEKPYEKNGVIPNVVFSSGAVVIGEKLFVYYGCADTCIGVATAKLKDIVSSIVR